MLNTFINVTLHNVDLNNGMITEMTIEWFNCMIITNASSNIGYGYDI